MIVTLEDQYPNSATGSRDNVLALKDIKEINVISVVLVTTIFPIVGRAIVIHAAQTNLSAAKKLEVAHATRVVPVCAKVWWRAKSADPAALVHLGSLKNIPKAALSVFVSVVQISVNKLTTFGVE